MRISCIRLAQPNQSCSSADTHNALQEAAAEQKKVKARAGACLARMRNWKLAQAFLVWQEHVANRKVSAAVTVTEISRNARIWCPQAADLTQAAVSEVSW